MAEWAKMAKLAEAVPAGSITRDMLSQQVLTQLDANGSSASIGPITRDMLPASVLNDLNKTIVITRDMLPQDVRDDLNKTTVITRQMLPADVLADLNHSISAGSISLNMLAPEVRNDLNRRITKQMLGNDVLTDINATIGMSRLSSEVTEKLNQEKTTTNYHAPSVGSLLAVPSGSDAPSGYLLYQRGEPKELVWEEKAPVSVARYAYDGVEVLDGKIYFVGGQDGSSSKNIAERYDPPTNAWESIASMSVARKGVGSSVLNGKLYAIGGVGLSSVEVFDPNTGNWIVGVALPSEVNQGAAITVNGKIYLIGGRNASGQRINQVLCLDPSSNQWTAMANMPTARSGNNLVWFENRIWAIGGNDGSYSKKVESYDPNSDSWRIEVSLSTVRHWSVAWVSSGKIYAGGGINGSSHLQSIEVYDPTARQWANAGNFPEKKFAADAVVLNNKVYVIAGENGSSHSNKVFAADLNASVEGVYDLYRKDGDAPVGTPVVQSEYADGSVTTAKLDSTILKYLKPEITLQPQALAVNADSNASFSVIAEGKYLTYQWKKDGVDLVGETNNTLFITDANATNHDGNYSVVVSNDFGSLESEKVEVEVYDFSPIYAEGLIGWFDANDTATVLNNNNFISKWLDKSDLKNNFYQDISNNMPVFSNNGIVFDGVNDSLELETTISKSSISIIYIKKSSDTISLDFVGQSNSQYAFVSQSGSNSGLFHDFGTPQTYVNGELKDFANRSQVFDVVHNSQLNLVSIMYGNSSSWSEFKIGNYPSYEFSGSFYEIIFLQGLVSFDTRSRIEGYLAHKWGLTSNLASNHPFKNKAP